MVVDEDPFGKLIKGFDGPICVSLHDLVPRRDGMTGVDWDTTADLKATMSTLYVVLDSAAVGDSPSLQLVHEVRCGASGL